MLQLKSSHWLEGANEVYVWKEKTKEENLTFQPFSKAGPCQSLIPPWAAWELLPVLKELQMHFEASCAEVLWLLLLYFEYTTAAVEIGSSEYSPGWRLGVSLKPSSALTGVCVPSYRDREENFLVFLPPVMWEVTTNLQYFIIVINFNLYFKIYLLKVMILAVLYILHVKYVSSIDNGRTEVILQRLAGVFWCLLWYGSLSSFFFLPSWRL